MKIEAATTRDAQAIAQVHVASWQSAYKSILPEAFLASLSVADRSVMWQQIIEDQTAGVWIAKQAESVCGFISFAKSRDTDAVANTAEIQALYLLPSCWSKGIGWALLEAAMSQIKQSGFDCVTLWVLANNERAIRFYQQAGLTLDVAANKTITLGGLTVNEQRFHNPMNHGN